MTSILFLIVRIYSNRLKCNYLKMLMLLLNFSNLNKILNILEKKMTLAAYVFPKFQNGKITVTQMFK